MIASASHSVRRSLAEVVFHMQESPHEPMTPGPVIPEVMRPTQYGAAPHSDIEILTTFDDDTSSTRDDYTAWVTADPTTIRARHMTDKGDAKPVFREARIRKCPSPSEYKFDTSNLGTWVQTRNTKRH